MGAHTLQEKLWLGARPYLAKVSTELFQRKIEPRNDWTLLLPDHQLRFRSLHGQ